VTPLDRAYAKAMQTKDEWAFYNAFLNATLYIPTVDIPAAPAERRAGQNETFSPVLIENEGNKYLMLFDTEKRLGDWARREVGFVALAGHAIVEMMDAQFHWALNAGTDYMKTFVPDEIRWLKQSLQNAEERQVESGTRVIFGAPAQIPVKLIVALKKNLETRNREVKTAWLGQVHYVKPGERPHLALIIQGDLKDKATTAAICEDLVAAIGPKNLGRSIPRAPFSVRKRSVLLPSGRTLRFGRAVKDHRIVKDVLIILFEASGPDHDNVLALDRGGKVLWRKPSRIRFPIAAIRSSPDSVCLFVYDTWFRVRPRTGKVVRTTFTK
jgi:hypothetical protein